MTYQPIQDEDLNFFTGLLGVDRCLSDEESRRRCGSDETEDLVFLPDVVLCPQTTAEVSRVLAYCSEHKIAVTPRGSGTGLSGGALPLVGGVSLDMCRMNQILDVDRDNFQVTTEPGVITEVLQDTVARAGMFYPVDPASRGSCSIGGNVAENSGGPRAVKYGTVKDYVLSLEIVLPSGEVMRTGANTIKNATGYNLTQLIVGSEGTLAVVTKIVLRLRPLPGSRVLLLARFASADAACRAVNGILTAGLMPSALEFMERDAIVLAQEYLAETIVDLPPEVAACLLIEWDGYDNTSVLDGADRINQVLTSFTSDPVMFAADNAPKERLWRLRRVVGEAVKHSSVYKEEDTVVPRALLPQLLAHVKEVGTRYGFRSVCYGHAGDGNLHINILKDSMSDSVWKRRLPEAIRAIFDYVVSVGGTLSGEHGIGYVQRSFMEIAFSSAEIKLMRQLKQVFDPMGILNPGKIFPEIGEAGAVAGNERSG